MNVDTFDSFNLTYVKSWDNFCEWVWLDVFSVTIIGYLGTIIGLPNVGAVIPTKDIYWKMEEDKLGWRTPLKYFVSAWNSIIVSRVPLA